MIRQFLRIFLSTAMFFGAANFASAAAAPVVYHCPTPSCVNPGVPHTLSSQTEPLDLYFSPGANVPGTGTACLDGTGDEICGITISLQPSGDLEFVSFDEDLTNDLIVNFSPPSTLIINRLNGTVGDQMPVRLGTLTVNLETVDGDVSVDISKSEAVGASLQNLAVVDNGMIAVPEPSFVLSIALGAAVLGFAGWRRLGRA